MQKRNPYTGILEEEEKHPILNTIRAGIEGALPLTRPVAAGLAALMPEGEYKEAMDPYKGKDLLSKVLSGGADIANTATIAAMPAEGIIANTIKYGTQGLLGAASGIGSKLLSKQIESNPLSKKIMDNPIAEGVMNYGLPALSIVASGKPLLNWMGKTENMTGNVTNFLKNKLTKGKTMEAMGFDSSGGKLKDIADELSDSIQRGVNASKSLSTPVYDKVKPMPVPKDMIQKLVIDMEEAKSPLTDRGSEALNKDIDKYINQINKFKNATVGDIDSIKQSFRNDMKEVKNDFSSSTIEATGNNVSHLMQKNTEDALPDDLRLQFIDAKKNWGTMAKHLQAIKNASKADPTTIMNNLKKGEQIDALAHFADPIIVDKALKTTAHYKHMNDPEKMINEYTTRLQQMDAVNPGIAEMITNIGVGKIANKEINPLTNWLNNKQYQTYTKGESSPWSDIINEANIQGAAELKGKALPLSKVPKYVKPSDILLNAGGNLLNTIQAEENKEKEQ